MKGRLHVDGTIHVQAAFHVSHTDSAVLEPYRRAPCNNEDGCCQPRTMVGADDCACHKAAEAWLVHRRKLRVLLVFGPLCLIYTPWAVPAKKSIAGVRVSTGESLKIPLISGPKPDATGPSPPKDGLGPVVLPVATEPTPPGWLRRRGHLPRLAHPPAGFPAASPFRRRGVQPRPPRGTPVPATDG